MACYSFTVDQDNCENEKLFGYKIKVRTMEYPGYEPDVVALSNWCIGIAEEVVSGCLSREDLIEECINIMVNTPEGTVLVDTLHK